MAAPAGFSDLINRKYDILQDEATNRGALEQAQAASIASSTPFENALKAAQAFQTNETGKTIDPLAKASQAATYAGVGETQARAGLYGAQTALTGAQTQDITADLGSIGRLGSQYFLDQLRRGGTAFAPGGTAAPAAATGGTPGLSTTKSIFNASPAGGASPPPAGVAPTAAPGTPPPGAVNGRLGFVGGDYDAFGNYRGGFAKGTTKVPKPAKGATPVAGAEMGAGGLPGLAGILQAALGATMVPGHGSGKVDTVDAKLAPGEAVVNKAAIKHIPGGRATIAKANAKGVKEMGMSKGKGRGMVAPNAKPHFAFGTLNVQPTPTPAPTPTPVPTGPPPPQGNDGWGGQNQGLRLQLGMGKPRV